MIRPMLLLLLLTLLALPSFSAGCKSAPEIVVVKTPACDPGPRPIRPQLEAAVCGDQVCLPPANASALWLWIRDNDRWAERVEVCRDNTDAPLPAKSVVDLGPLVRDLSVPGVTYTIEIRAAGGEYCKSLNAWYFPDTKAIVVCAQLADHPALEFYVAHEIAHAIMMQLDLPIVGSYEVAADELAIVMLSMTGREEVLRIAAGHWLHEHKQGEVPDWADHPRNLRRHHVLRCAHLEATKAPKSPTCDRPFLDRAQRTWARLIVGAVQP